MSVLAISFDYFPTYFIIALCLIKGKNSLYMVKIILHFKRAFYENTLFCQKNSDSRHNSCKKNSPPHFFLFFCFFLYHHKTKLFRELRYDLHRFTHCGRFRAKHCLYSGH